MLYLIDVLLIIRWDLPLKAHDIGGVVRDENKEVLLLVVNVSCKFKSAHYPYPFFMQATSFWWPFNCIVQYTVVESTHKLAANQVTVQIAEDLKLAYSNKKYC